MEDRRGMPNSISFNKLESSPILKLQPRIAPIVSAAPLERRGTLDQPPQLHNYSNTPDPDPAAPVQAETSTSSISSTKYRECLKNHAASMGNYVVDGCGEFMPQVGTSFESMRCAACNCHRSFHRRVGDPHHSHPPSVLEANNIHHHQVQPFPAARTTTTTQYPIMMKFGGNSTAESSSEDFNMFQSSPGGHAMASSSSKKKRFRTKFNREQKDRMHEFAEKLGWRIQRQDDEQVHEFCREVGVKRQVFKVWMHNNKQAMKKKI
ncbi:zinc-finger homeodomain protein 7-like [Henckelia pumila]|uniref:zinc-finger homeodomain protein 7-like n=1 Tax=Henckelia pumila TaxID=405737 RepID=UPI003C6E1DFB